MKRVLLLVVRQFEKVLMLLFYCIMQLARKLYKWSTMLHTRTTISLAAAMRGDVADDDLEKLRVVEKLSQLSEMVYDYGLKVIRDKVKANLIRETFQASLDHARIALKKKHWQRKQLFPNGESVDESSMDVTRWAIMARYATKDCENFDWDRALTDSDVDWRHDIMRIRQARNALAHRSDNDSHQNERQKIDKHLTDVEKALIRLGVPKNKVHDVRHQKTLSVYLSYKRTDFLITANTGSESFPYMLRNGWKADLPKGDMSALQPPVRHVVISHTCGETCYTTEACCASVLNVQRIHMGERGFSDIGFNFLIGNDGIVYEGRGFDWQGAFATGWNGVSIGIAFIGLYYGQSLPSPDALRALDKLLRYLVSKNILQSDYIVYALRQIRPFPDAPGSGLFELMKTWPHWQERTMNDLQ